MSYYLHEYDEKPECVVLSSAMRKARKPHKCTCGAWIEPGEHYQDTVMLVDGEFETLKEGCHMHEYEKEEYGKPSNVIAINFADDEEIPF